MATRSMAAFIKGAGGGGGQNIINIDAADTLTLDGVTAQGNTDGTGTVDNSGTIMLENTLTLAGVGVTLLLDDAGTVSLNGATITGSNTGETLENNANTISGAGQIGNGNGDLTLQNDADGNITAQGGTLTIDAGVINNGTMTAASGATLNLAGQSAALDRPVIDAGGTVVVGALDQQAITYRRHRHAADHARPGTSPAPSTAWCKAISSILPIIRRSPRPRSAARL